MHTYLCRVKERHVHFFCLSLVRNVFTIRTDAYKYSTVSFPSQCNSGTPPTTACQSTLPLFQGALSSLSSQPSSLTLFLTTTDFHHSFTIHPSQVVFPTFIALFLPNFTCLSNEIEVEYLSRSRPFFLILHFVVSVELLPFCYHHPHHPNYYLQHQWFCIIGLLIVDIMLWSFSCVM